MLAVPQRAFVANQPVDMRRSIDGLALLVEAV
ncbi:transposase, partial [Chitinimonas sp. BJB300]